MRPHWDIKNTLTWDEFKRPWESFWVYHSLIYLHISICSNVHTHFIFEFSFYTEFFIYPGFSSNTLYCYVRCPNPRAGREKASKTMQLSKKGKFIADSSQGSRRASNTVVRGQRAQIPSCYPIYKVCLSSW